MAETGEASTKRRERRRIYIIDRHFQYRVMTTWLFLSFALVAVVIGIVATAHVVLREKEVSRIALDHVAQLFKYSALAIILVILVAALYTLLLSHRVAGPAYRLHRCLQRMARGDYDFKVMLRKRDYLKNLADGVNELSQGLLERERNVVRALESLEGLSGEASAERREKLLCEAQACLKESLRKLPEEAAGS